MNPDPLRLRSQQVKLGREFLGCAPVVSSPSTLINASKSRRMPLYFHALYTGGIAPDARFPRSRYERLRSRLSRGEASELLEITEAPRARREDILLAHEPEYTARFLSGSMDRAERRRIGLRPWTPLLIPRTLHLLGGAIAALQHVAGQGGVAGNMAGGTHHAHYDFGSGFCVFNDLAICARIAHQRLGLERISVLDLDVHQGDGTATLLSEDDYARTISVHCAQNFPLRKASSDVDLPVDQGTSDDVYLEVVERALDAAFEHSPDLLFFQAGVDGLSADGLGRLELSREGLWARNARVFEACERAGIPCLVFMGGGYSKPIDHTVDAFEDLFVQAARSHQRHLTQRS